MQSKYRKDDINRIVVIVINGKYSKKKTPNTGLR